MPHTVEKALAIIESIYDVCLRVVMDKYKDPTPHKNAILFLSFVLLQKMGSR